MQDRVGAHWCRFDAAGDVRRPWCWSSMRALRVHGAAAFAGQRIE
jgi:hypothetical protein